MSTDHDSIALQDLMDLLAIPGPPGDERAVATHLRRTLESLGVPSSAIEEDQAQKQSEYGGNTGNLLVRLDGHGRGERWMFTAHMDTVPLAVGAQPRVEGNFIVNDAPGKALGGDNRAGSAVVLQVARTLLALKGQHAPVTLAFFIQEEVGLVGARGLEVAKLGSPKPSACFNYDCYSSDVIVNAVTGTERLNIEITGVAAHAGMNPERGTSAAIVAAFALSELARGGWHGKIVTPEGRGTSNAGILRGGAGSNVVLPELYILAEARSHEPAFRKVILKTWKDAFTRAAAEVRNDQGTAASVKFSPGPWYEAYAIPESAPVVQAVVKAGDACGVRMRCITDDGGMDANWIVAHGIPAITMGMGTENVHTADERIDLPHFYTGCRIARALAGMRATA